MNIKHKTLTKLISLILAQIFLFTGTVYQGSASHINKSNSYIYHTGLRLPLDSANNYSRERDVLYGAGQGTHTFSLGLEGIEQTFPVFGEHIRSAINFLGARTIQEGKPFLDGVSNIKIIKGSDATSAELSGSELIIRLGDTSFLASGSKQEIFLYFLYTLASARGGFGDESPQQGQTAGKPEISKQGELERVVLEDPATGETFMLVANFKKGWNRDKVGQFIGLAFDGSKGFNVNSTIIEGGICTEARSRRFIMPLDKRLWVGVPPGCEIFRFASQEEDPVFKIGDIRKILGVLPGLKEVLSFFVAAGIFEKEENAKIHRITIITDNEEKIRAEITTSDAKELIIRMPQGHKPDLAEAIEAIAQALGESDLGPQINKADRKMETGPELRRAVDMARQNIDRTREPMLSAIRAVWDRKRYIYKEMTKDREADKRNAVWVENNAPYLKNSVIVSWQLERGFHPELTLSLMDVLQDEIDAGDMTIEEADSLLKEIAMANMAGGLGALMPDWLRALADNGADVVSLNIIHDTYEYGTNTGKRHIDAIRRMPGARAVEDLEAVLKDGRKVKFNFYMCKLGGVLDIWIEGWRKLYEGDPASPARVNEMDFYNSAGQAALKWLQENRTAVNNSFIAQDNLIFLENELYTYLPKKMFPDAVEIGVNHTVIPGAMARYRPDDLRGLVEEDTLKKITDADGFIRLEVLALMRAKRMLGVSKDHTRILREIVFAESLESVGRKLGLDPGQRAEFFRLFDKIVLDERYGTSNGAHPKHFQPPEIQDLIEKYKGMLGDKGMDDDQFAAGITADPNNEIKERFKEELDSIRFELQRYLTALLKTQGQTLDWEPDRERATGGILRRIVEYKELVRFADILEDPSTRERFKRSGVRVIVGGRFGEATLNRIKKDIEDFRLRDQVAVFNDYNITDAPIIFGGEVFTVMLSQKGKEAAATSPQKLALSGGIGILVRDGIGHESEGFLEEYDFNTGQGNGFVVKYGEDGRPMADSLLDCFEKTARAYRDLMHRKNIQFNSLMKGLRFNEVTHQARGTLNIMNRVLAEHDILRRQTSAREAI